MISTIEITLLILLPLILFYQRNKLVLRNIVFISYYYTFCGFLHMLFYMRHVIYLVRGLREQ